MAKPNTQDLVEVCLPDGTEVEIDPSGDEAAAGIFAQDGRELARGAAVEVLASEDAGQRGRVQDVTGQYVTVTFPDGSALRTSAGNVRCMSAIAGPVACPYCNHTVTMDAWQRLRDHRVHGGVCDGAGRHVERKDAGGRAVLAQTFARPVMMETFVAKAVGHRGNELGSWESNTVDGAMRAADAAAPKGAEITIRGETTSDGTNHGKGRGRVVAVREGSTGRWQRY
jgi:hypothetical protein